MGDKMHLQILLLSIFSIPAICWVKVVDRIREIGPAVKSAPAKCAGSDYPLQSYGLGTYEMPYQVSGTTKYGAIWKPNMDEGDIDFCFQFFRIRRADTKGHYLSCVITSTSPQDAEYVPVEGEVEYFEPQLQMEACENLCQEPCVEGEAPPCDLELLPDGPPVFEVMNIHEDEEELPSDAIPCIGMLGESDSIGGIAQSIPVRSEDDHVGEITTYFCGQEHTIVREGNELDAYAPVRLDHYINVPGRHESENGLSISVPRFVCEELCQQPCSGDKPPSFCRMYSMGEALPPHTTTEAIPEMTTDLPAVTTTIPAVTTDLPEMTTDLPEMTTDLPEMTTDLPEMTTSPIEPIEPTFPTKPDSSFFALIVPVLEPYKDPRNEF